jgi:predicted metalloprotease
VVFYEVLWPVLVSLYKGIKWVFWERDIPSVACKELNVKIYFYLE